MPLSPPTLLPLALTVAVTGASLRMLPWDLARAAGLVAYLLLTAAVTLGILESTPRLGRASGLRRLTHHYHRWVMLFALAFVVLHVTFLVADPYAGVSLAAVFVPGLAQYRPLATSLGTLTLLAGLLTGVSAWFPVRFPRVWLPIHRAAGVIFALAWLHGVTAGTDTPKLLLFYALTGGLPLAAAALRYILTRPSRGRPAGLRAPAADGPPTGRAPARR
jgi:predicted ferric reductase